MDIKKLFVVLISATIGLNCLTGVAFAEDMTDEDASAVVQQDVISTELPSPAVEEDLAQEETVVEVEDVPAATSARIARNIASESMQQIYGLFTDGWNGGKTTTNASATTARTQSNVVYGASGKALRFKTTLEQGIVNVVLSDGSLFKDLDKKVEDAIGSDSAYFGFWYYREEGTTGDLVMTVDGVDRTLDTSLTDTWQFVTAKISDQTAAVTFSFTGGDTIVDEIGIYMEALSDVTPVVEPIYYDAAGNTVNSTTQGVSGYFDIGFNFSVEDSSLVEFVVLRNNSTEDPATIDVKWPDSKTARIGLKNALDFSTEYTVTISNYENVYGGVLDSYSFVFKTQPAPIQFTHTETMNSGMVTSAEIHGNLTNTTDDEISLTLYALAKVGEQTISIKSMAVSVPTNDTIPVDITLTFDRTNAQDITFTYFLLGDDMTPVNDLMNRQDADMTVDAVEILGNVLSVNGSFSQTGNDRYVLAAVMPSDVSAFNHASVVSMAAATTKQDGTFTLSDSLYDGLDSGTYTVFVWGEGDSDSQRFTFYYASLRDREGVMSSILNGQTADILDSLNDEDNEDILDTLGILISAYKGLSDDGKEIVAANLSAEENKNESNLPAVANSSIALQVVNEADDANIGQTVLDYAQYFALSDTAKKLLDAISPNPQGLSALLQDVNLISVLALDVALSGQDAILLAIGSVTQPEQVRALLADFSSELGFSAEQLFTEHDISESNILSICTEMLGKVCDSKQALQDELNILISKYVEGPPYQAEELLSIFTDSVQGGYTSKWNGVFNATQDAENFKVGSQSLYIHPVTAYSDGVIWLDSPISNDQEVQAHISYGTAYLGMWAYAPSGVGWYEIILCDGSYNEHTKIYPDGDRKDEWQYLMVPITQDIRYIMFKTTDDVTGFWVDDIKVYAVPPEDNTATVSEVVCYDRYQERANNQNQFVGTYFDVVYNLPTKLSLVGDIVLKNKETNTVVNSTFSIENNGFSVRIMPGEELEYDTEYTVTIGRYANIFGGVLDGYTFDFKTCLVPIRENLQFNKAAGQISTATLTGTLYNDDKNIPNLTVYAQARVAGETVGLAYQTVNFANVNEQPVMLNVNFPATNSADVQLSYYVLTDNMLPISIMVPQATSAIALDSASLVSKNMQITGSFQDKATRIVMAAVTKGAQETYNPADAVIMMQTTTNADGKFVLNESFYDYLDTDYYTVFIWGEGADKIFGVQMYYSGRGSRDAAMTVLGGSDQAAIATLLDDADEQLVLQSMGMLVSEYSKLNTQKSSVAAYIAALPTASKNTESSAIAELNAKIVLAMMKETPDQAADILTKYAAYLGIAERTMYLINSVIDDGNADEINDLLKASTLSNTKQLDTILKNNMLMMAINSIHSNNHIKMKELLELYKSDLGFDAEALIEENELSEYNATRVYQGMINQNFASAGASKTKFNNLINQYKPTGGSSNSSNKGSSDSKGGSAGSGIPVSVPINVQTTKTEQPATSFTDIDGHWAKESILYLLEKGIVSGKSSTQFCPNDNITREEFVKILVSALELVDETATADFGDVAPDRWSYRYVASAHKLGIVSGYPDGTFGASRAITREDMAAIIFRALDITGKQLDALHEMTAFADDEQISDYAKEAVATLRQAGIIHGSGNNEFMPKKNSTRAEATQMIYSLIK